ncbi:hypothetical protein MMC17_002141 [Xylographa soralifera]|nr:hypothetical protein [Xylographa soralifera]
MKLFDLNPLPNGTFELEKGHTERDRRNGDVFVLQYGCIETHLALKGEDNAEFFLPSPLEDNSLMTIRVAPDGLYTDKDGVVYKDEDGIRQKLATSTIEDVRSMSIG